MRMDQPPSAKPPAVAQAALDCLRARIAADPPGQIKAALQGYEHIAAELFRGVPIPGARLGGQDLIGLDFTGADLRGADFTGALIAGARFETARVTQAQLRKAQDWREHVFGWTLAGRPFPSSLDEGDRFSIAPFAPELVLLPSSLALDCDPPIGVGAEEWTGLSEGRLAMALMPVTVSQFSFHLAALGRREAWSDSERSTAKEMSVREARNYLAWVRRRTAADFRVPSHGLLAFLARKGRHDGDEQAAITVLTSKGAHKPASVDLDSAPGEGRCNRFGLHDIFGNTREFVDIGAGDRTSADDYQARLGSVGGCFRESREAAFDLHKQRSLHVTGREHGLRLNLLLPKPKED
ncbi:MAG: pentapeptide repeat-containing protein [Bryobacteraceae bacterium]